MSNNWNNKIYEYEKKIEKLREQKKDYYARHYNHIVLDKIKTNDK